MDPAPEPNKPRRLVDGPRLLAGIVVAALAAGPVFFIAGTLLSGLITSPGEEVFHWAAEAEALPVTVLLSIRYAFLPAVLPVTLGAAAMAVLGAMFRGARAWLAWMLAGAILAGLICLLFPDLLSFRLLAAALLVTGIVCGIICRAFARWPEDADAADRG
jgi:hypothetical protein